MTFEINYTTDENFHIPIKYLTKGTHLPPPEEISNKKILMISRIINFGTSLISDNVCYSIEKCTEGKCKGAITILRESEESILWQCNKCLTKGKITDFENTPHDRSNNQDHFDGPLCIQLTPKQYSALSSIRGLPEAAHSMVATPTIFDSTVVIGGEEDALEELTSTISEELDYDMCKKSDQTHLFTILEKIDEVLECDIHIC